MATRRPAAKGRTVNYRMLLLPHRLRTIEKPFGWLPCRLLTGGIIAIMSPTERQLYLFLSLAADRHGLSFYSEHRICSALRFDPQDLALARDALIARDLLAYDGETYQLLSLPTKPSRPNPNPTLAPASPRQAIQTQGESARPPEPTKTADACHPRRVPDDVRNALCKIFGPGSF